MGDPNDVDSLEARPSNRLYIATTMAALSGMAGLLALSIKVASVPADRLWTFVFFLVDVVFPGSVVWLCHRVGINELLFQFSLTSWVFFILGLASPMGMPTVTLTLALAVIGLVVTNTFLIMSKADHSTFARDVRFWRFATAVSWHLFGAGLLLMPLAMLWWSLGLISVE